MEKKNILVTLKKSDNRDVLEFQLGTAKSIDLNSEDQKGLRELFDELIMVAIKEKKEITFTLNVEEGYTDILFNNMEIHVKNENTAAVD